MIGSYDELTASSALFQLFANEVRNDLQRMASLETFEPGSYVVKQGETATHVFLLQAGEVEVSTVRDGSTTTLARLGPGAIVGELAGIAGGMRTATVRAIDEVQTVKFPSEPFLALCRRTPKAEAALANIVNRRAEDTLEKTLK